MLVWCLMPQLPGQFYYGTRMEFGKNRVQFNEFDWTYYRFDRFDVYFYRGNDELADQVSRMVNRQLPRMENQLDAPLNDRLQILLFNNLSDLKQSNVNSSTEEDYNTGGVTRISGRRLFLHFNGSYDDLETQIRSGLAEVVLSNLIYGSFTESLKNSTLLNLPEWYMEGLVSYLGENWSAEIDNRVRDGFYSGRFKRINTLSRKDARYAGHSMWYFITQTYGEKVLKNIVYMSILNRDIESGFNYILGEDLDAITKNWRNFYKARYELEATDSYFTDKPVVKAPRKHLITRMELSPNGRYLAYVQQRFSRYKVFIYDRKEDKRNKILVDGYRIAQNADYSYPLLAWHPNNEMLAMITEEEGFVYLNFYNREDDELEKKKFFKFDKVLDFSYSNDGKRFVVSATNDGQSDIYIYTILNTKVEQITDDDYDDLHPAFFDNDQRIAFSSNRPVDSLYPEKSVKNFDNFQLDLFAAPARELEDTLKIWRMTNSPDINETRATQYQDGFISFMSDRNGRYNQHLIQIDSSIAYVDTTVHYSYSFEEYQLTDYDMGILDQEHHAGSDATLELVRLDERYKIFEKSFQDPRELNLLKVEKESRQGSDTTAINNTFLSSSGDSAINIVPLYYPGVNPDNFEVDIYDYQFEDEKKEEKQPKRDTAQKPQRIPSRLSPETLVSEGQSEEEELEIPSKKPYFLTFFQDNFTTRFDAMFDNNQYQKFTGFVSSDLLNSGTNVNFKVGTLELMHDYRIVAGVQTGFQPLAGTSLAPNAEFYVGVADYRDRLDLNYTYNRRSQVQFLTNTDWQRLISNQVTTEATWPFNPVASLRGSLGIRHDRTITLSRETSSLEEPDITETYGIARLAYVYDNTRKLGINLYSGLRFKLFTEYYQNFNISPSGMHTAGADFRHYQIIHRNLIWANRFAYGLSFGPEQLAYIMGGTDNAFNPQLETTTPIAEENNYIFQTLVTNMRGFFQNARNGNQFTVLNSELRWPIISYFFRRPIRSDFFKNLQVVGFADVGTAWNGPTPWSDENAINTRTINRGDNLEIVLDTQKDPFILGYGAGIRSRLFGYFFRIDWAWGVEDGIILPSEFYFSLSTDF